MKILVTGGAGYIGSHTVLELLNAGHEVVVMDNLSNSSETSLQRVAELAGRAPEFHNVDLLDLAGMKELFVSTQPDAVIHFAGLKAVGESAQKPLWYYQTNVAGTLNLLYAMEEANCRSIVFSSSATVYGEPESMPLVEKLNMDAQSCYGRTKEHIEDMLVDLAASDDRWNIALLRYFNPVGAHESGRIGEDPSGIPNNLVPFIAQVAVGRREHLNIFGNDYPTVDGTGVRDYIHVVDLALGHLKSMQAFAKTGTSIYNLGSGRGTSVLEIMHAFEEANHAALPHHFAERRPGDLAEIFADPSKAKRELNWETTHTIEDAMRDTINFLDSAK